MVQNMQFTEYVNSPIGLLKLESDGENLTGLNFQGEMPHADQENSARQKQLLEDLNKTGQTSLPVFKETRRWLKLYFEGKDPGFTPKLKPAGSEFSKSVGEIMLTIPFGETMTYGEIDKQMAAKTGKAKMSAQAVGGAVGHNPIGIIIPCHRVIGAGGKLTGYAGGLDRKIFLLQNEGRKL